MEQKWMKLLANLGETAKSAASEIPKALADDELTRDQAERLWVSLGKLADQASELVDMMDDHDADEVYIEPAETLQDIFLDLHVAVGERAIALGSTLKI